MKEKIIIPIDSNFNSTLLIGTEEFPLQVFYDDLRNFSNGFVNWHKQKQVEISLVLEGGVLLKGIGEEIKILPGEIFLIFPEYLHSVKPLNNTTTRYVTLIFDPVILYGYKGSFYEKQYYSIFVKNAYSLVHLHAGVEWMTQVKDEFLQITNLYPVQSCEQMLNVQHALQKLWITLYKHKLSDGTEMKKGMNNAKIFTIFKYLHQNFAEKFSLEKLAEYTHISKGECCRFFKKMMNMTIMDYLTEYRIARSIELLETTDLTVTEVAQRTGFGSTSYYITKFKEKTAVSPLKYRQQNIIS